MPLPVVFIVCLLPETVTRMPRLLLLPSSQDYARDLVYSSASALSVNPLSLGDGLAGTECRGATLCNIANF